MLRLHPLCLFSEVTSRLFSSGVLSHDFHRNICTACAMSVVIFWYLNRSFYLLTPGQVRWSKCDLMLKLLETNFSGWFLSYCQTDRFQGTENSNNELLSVNSNSLESFRWFLANFSLSTVVAVCLHFCRGVFCGVQNYLKSDSTLSVTNETRALTLDACSRLVYPLCQLHQIVTTIIMIFLRLVFV